MDISARNDLFFDYTDMIKRTMRRNRLLLVALHLEPEDVYQELAMAALQAIDSFDPGRSSSLSVHVWMKLQYAVLTMRRQQHPFGLTGLNGTRPILCSIDHLFETEGPLTVPAPEESSIESSQLQQALDRLDPQEREAVIRYLEGNKPRQKQARLDFDSALDKLRTLYMSGQISLG